MFEYELPKLPYDYNHFEPKISEQIMILHHKKHHQNYINNLNKKLEKTNYSDSSIGSLIIKVFNDPSLDSRLKDEILFHAGGHYNHSLYWLVMGSRIEDITIQFKQQIENDFKSFDNFKSEFINSALNVLGIGWQYLCFDPKKQKLILFSTYNQDTPLVHDFFPIIACDLWEHAYYLQYKTEKKKFLEIWFSLIDWKNVNVFFDMAKRNKYVDFFSDGKVDLMEDLE